MINHKLLLAYDGTAYSGFQRQKNALSIQEIIERALGKLYGTRIKVEGASRTDAGVHARGQVINYFSPGNIPIERLPFALNSILPSDIVAYRASEVDDHFNARKNAYRKRYVYIIDNGTFPDVFKRNYTWHVPSKLDIKAMKSAAWVLLGRHDFKAFQSAGSSVIHTVRTLFEIDIIEEGCFLYFSFEGDGFLYKMVRAITGTLVEIGLGKKESEDMEEILCTKDRSQAGKTSPASGLCLEKVLY